MKNIITALANPMINQELKKQKNINILFQDIQYQEAIFEILEMKKNTNIDYFILSEILTGRIEITNLISKIKKINAQMKIILILENKNENLEKILYEQGIDIILYSQEINIEKIIQIINHEEIKKEIIKNPENIFQKINSSPEKQQNIQKIKSEIISISGPSGVGKSIISVNIAKAMANQKKKILIIDFDILNSSIHTILGVKKYPEKIEKNKNLISQLIVKINQKIDLLSITELLFHQNNHQEFIELLNKINQLKQIYNAIIIDTSSECFFEDTKNIIKNSNKNIFVTEANILEIKKAKNLLNIYIHEWKIDKNKFNILFNKYNEEAISIHLLKKLFQDFNILGVLNYEKKYNKLINKNMKNNFMNKKIKNEYLKIQKKL